MIRLPDVRGKLQCSINVSCSRFRPRIIVFDTSAFSEFPELFVHNACCATSARTRTPQTAVLACYDNQTINSSINKNHLIHTNRTIYKEGHLGASRTRGKHMDAMWCHVKCHVRRRACEAVGRPCRACEAPWVWAEPARPPVRLSCVEHRETLPACR